MRTPTGQCILHSAMLKGEPEVVAWLLYNHPGLLAVTDEQRDSPVIIALKELSATLLRHHTKPSDRTAWKRAKLAEILLSDQVQAFRVPWNLTHFRSLGDIAVPLLGELAQQMALAFNLTPPAGFVRISKWHKYPGDIPAFLAQCYVACRDSVDAPRCELGDLGRVTFQALMQALEMRQTTITISSNFFNCYPISIVRIDARANRLDSATAAYAAHAVSRNATLTYLDLRQNNIDDEGGVELARALGKSSSLTMFSIASNRLGPPAGIALGNALKKHPSLKTLNLANNRLGPRLIYTNEFTAKKTASSGPQLCRGLRMNTVLTALDVSENNLGPKAAKALDGAFRKNADCALKVLGFAGNDLRTEGGKHLAHALKTRVQLTALDASRNRLGPAAGVAFAGAIKKNSALCHLNLEKNGLGTKGGKSIAVAVQDNHALVSLDLSDNGFGPDVLRAFSAALLKQDTLTYLDLSDPEGGNLTKTTFLGGAVEMSGGMLASMVQGNKVLAALDLGGIEYNTDELLAALTGFAKNTALRDIGFRGQPFDNASALTLCNTLEIHRHRESERDEKMAGQEETRAAKKRMTVVDSTQWAGLERIDLSDCRIGTRTGPVTVAALFSLPHVKDVLLAGNNLGAKLAERVAELFVDEDCEVETLDISRNQLSDVGGGQVARALEHNVTLTDLDLSENELGGKVGVMVADALIELVESGFVARPAHIVRICLANNPLGSNAAIELFRALRNPVCRDIDLSFCDIGPEAGKDCGLCLRRSVVQWTRLNLEGNNLGKDGANPIFWALRVNCTLTELMMSDNKIGADFGTDRDKMGEHGNSLAGAIEYNYTLRRMDLARNDLSRECATCVAQALLENPCLVAFNFERNGFDATAADQLATRLSTDGQIKYLNLRCNNVSWTGAVRFAAALETNIGLLHVDLGYNGAGSCGPIAGRAIASALEKNENLRHLDLEGNELGPEAGCALATAIARNNTLRYLNVRNNRFDARTGAKWLEGVRANLGLMEICFSTVEIGADHFQQISRLMRARASVAGMVDPDVPTGGNTDVFALAEVDSDSPSDDSDDYSD
jgi:Ran GTPase-activating protein (RanGAP) involved in mRNA processing and transport